MLIAALLLGWLVCPAEAFAQDSSTPVRSFRSFTRAASRELPQSTVVALHEDAQGVIWIATLDGVAKVERGVVERLAPLPNAPLTGPFSAFAHRQDGGVHIVGSAGVFTWDGSAWSRLDTPQVFVAIAEDAERRLIAVDRAGRVWSRHGGSSSWVESPDTAPTEFVALARRSDGVIFAGGRRGVVQLSGTRLGQIACGGPPASAVTVMVVSGTGTLWAGGDDGRVHVCAAGAGAWRMHEATGWSGGRVRSIAEDARGRIWIGGDRGEVAFATEGVFSRWTPANGLKAATVMAIVGDRTGSVWFGFNGAGVQQWLGEAWSHRPYWNDPSETSSMYVFSVTPTADGGFLAAVFSRGVMQWDGKTMRLLGRDRGITEDIRYAVEPEPGVIWAGGRFALFESRQGRPFTRILTLPVGFVNGVFRAPDGRWWAATSGTGVLVQDGSRWKPLEALNSRLPDQDVRHVVWRANGEVWLATGRGLAVFRGDTFAPVPMALPPTPTFTYALVQRSNDEMWVAGAGGISVYRDGAWRVMQQSDGLPGNTVYALARGTGGSMWAGGSAGIGRFVSASAAVGGADAWTVYDASNGLISDEANSHGLLVLPNGDVLAGTMSGLARYGGGVDELPLPPLRLFWRGDVVTPPFGTITLPASNRSLRLQWMAPWPRPATVEYRTRIAGLDAEWSAPQTTPELRVENLAAGHWRVEVSSRLQQPAAAAWTEPIAATVDVQPFWWERWWAMAAGLLMLAGGIGFGVHWRTTRLAERATALETSVQEALARVKVLRGLLPICAHCKKIRDDRGYWRRLEDFIGQHSEADFSHGLCPDCEHEHYPETR